MDDRIDTVITDGSLRRLAREGSASAARVLVEVDGSTEPVEVAARRGRIEGRPVTVAVAAAAGNGPPAEAASAVSRIVGGTPRYLRAARSFVVIATGAQLAALANSPAVVAIRPDRALRSFG